MSSTWKLLEDEPVDRGGLGYFAKRIGVTDNIGFFSVNPARFVENPDYDRCDEGQWGAWSFHDSSSGSCTCGGIDTNEVISEICSGGVSQVSRIRYATPFMRHLPIGYVYYSEAQDPAQEELFIRSHWTSNARTVQEILKIMYEWSDVHTLLGDGSPIATVCHQLLQAFDVPESVEEWVRTEVPDGPVLRFLQGDPHARDRAEGIPNLADHVSRWLWFKAGPVVGDPWSQEMS